MNHHENNKKEILDYLNNNGNLCVVLACGVPDFIENTEDSKTSIQIFTDGIFVWSNTEIRHFEKYNIKLSDEFISHVLRVSKE
jgi:hypothetical protein